MEDYQAQTKVYVNDKVCTNSMWHEKHPVDGFPYITCNAQKGVVGTTNVTLFVADQWSKHLPKLDDVDRAVLRSVCLPSDYFLENGTQTFYWGRANPENCALNAQLELCADHHRMMHRLHLVRIG